jgi:predicted PolB exonuclease-like 3'-5' exonuclease
MLYTWILLFFNPDPAMASADVFILIDTESVPDGRLLSRVKYGAENLTPEEAIKRAQEEARKSSLSGSDFLPVSFQYPVAVCVLRVGPCFELQALTCLDAPNFRPRRIVEDFWKGIASYNKNRGQGAKMVTFNGRGFDLPLLEMAAFRYGVHCGPEYFANSRNRFGGGHLDLMEWLTNYGACRGQSAGGLNLLSKILGKPGKMAVAGDQVYEMHQSGKIKEINDYCMFDTLDTYFVFLRTRVMAGDISLEYEYELVTQAKKWITAKAVEMPALQQYLNNWGDWEPWPV